MSLDVSLRGPATERQCCCDKCNVVHTAIVSDKLYSGNITHNLNKMAAEAGIYKHLWRPEELGITTAKELIDPLTDGLELLESDPERFEKFNAPNGWGLYKHFVPFVREYRDACRRFPDATVEANR